MKINTLVVGIIVIVFAALLLADGFISYIDPKNTLFVLADVKGIVGVVLVILGASYLKASKD